MILFYSLRFFNPELATDWDIFVATLGLIYSSILIIHGWRLDPILLFSQLLVILISLSFGWILIRQREIIRQLIQLEAVRRETEDEEIQRLENNENLKNKEKRRDENDPLVLCKEKEVLEN